MRILFAGTPEIAVRSLHALHELPGDHSVVGVLTAPARPHGRGRKITPCPVAAAAEGLGLPVLAFETLKTQAREAVAALAPDVLVVFAYGKLFGPLFLELFPCGGINLHPSLLPRHRGPAPVPAAILSGDPVTGLTVQKIAREMDSGDILIQRQRSLDGSESAADVYSWAADEGAKALCAAVQGLADNSLKPCAQNHSEATYCSLLHKQDGEIDWRKPAEEIDRLIRAYNPYPGAFSSLSGQKITLWRTSGVHTLSHAEAPPGTVLAINKTNGILIQTGANALGITQLQLAHKKNLDWKSFCNGYGELSGQVFGGKE